jgi:hypothetical protein
MQQKIWMFVKENDVDDYVIESDDYDNESEVESMNSDVTELYSYSSIMYSRGGYWLPKTKMDSATSYYFINENFSTGNSKKNELKDI